MAYYLVELYSPKPAWLALDQASRAGFFEAVGAGMSNFPALGIEAVALGETEACAVHAAPQQFFAIWRAPDAKAMDVLISGIAGSGGHDYFDTVNAVGSGIDLHGHLAKLAAI